MTVAPFAPYPDLYACGPQLTWVKGLDEGAKVYSYSGERLSKRRRWISDLRDAIRFPGAAPQDIRTVDPTSPPLRAYATLRQRLKFDESVGTEERGQRTLLAQRFVVTLMRGTNLFCSWWAMFEGRHLQQNSKFQVSHDGFHYLSPRPATMTNHIRIQRDVLHELLSDASIDAFVFCTASVYIYWKRMRNWIERQSDDLDFAAVAVPDVGGRLYGGTVTYFSRRGAYSLVETDELDYGSLQDIAINDWLSSAGLTWSEIPVTRFESSSNHEFCPLCVSGEAVAVICTSHPHRYKESESMHFMYQHEVQHRSLN